MSYGFFGGGGGSRYSGYSSGLGTPYSSLAAPTALSRSLSPSPASYSVDRPRSPLRSSAGLSAYTAAGARMSPSRSPTLSRSYTGASRAAGGLSTLYVSDRVRACVCLRALACVWVGVRAPWQAMPSVYSDSRRGRYFWAIARRMFLFSVTNYLTLEFIKGRIVIHQTVAQSYSENPHGFLITKASHLKINLSWSGD